MIMIDKNSVRSIRQELGIQKWVDNKCKGSLCWATGVGKTRAGIIAIKRFLDKNPNRRILVVVPTEVLKRQWIKLLDNEGLSLNVNVQIINSVIKHYYTVDLLILDEVHRYAAEQMIQIFKRVSYAMILGLTATFERLDGREELLSRFCPVIDTITMEEAVSKGWASKCNVYKVIIDVPDIDVYLDLNKQFIGHFSYFNFDWNLAMGCVTNFDTRKAYARLLIGERQDLFEETLKECAAHAFSWNKALQSRKQFIYKHPKKLELAEKILAARPNSKAITFNATISECEKFSHGYIVHSGRKKKENHLTLMEFNQLKTGVIHSSKALTEGVDVKGLNLAIILHNTSSSTERIQKYGRVIRAEPGKIAEIFSIIINKTVECSWFKKSSSDLNFIELNEEELDFVLKHGYIDKQPIKQQKEKYLFTY